MDRKGFTLIELLIVVAIIGILAAIAIPGYIGMQERSRKGAVVRAAESAAPDLQGWVTAARKAGQASLLIEVDTDGNGAVVTPDLSNASLNADFGVANGLCSRYIISRWNLNNELSPWVANQSLWTIAAPAAGTISCQHAANSGISLVARDNNNNTLYSKTVTTD